MTRYAQPGRTVQLHGTLAHGQQLVALYGYGATPGALLEVASAFTNAGELVIDGSYGSGSAAATLENNGTLSNSGLLRVTGSTGGAFGPAGTQASTPGGGVLLNEGILLNTGEILLGGQPFTQFYFGYLAGDNVPGVLQDDGYVRNEGLVDVQAFIAGYYNFSGGSSGQLDIAGVFVNDGTLREEFGNLGYGGVGATVNVSGLLTNNADGLITGGYDLSAGSVLNVTAPGTLINAGMLTATYSNTTGMRIEVAGLLENSGTLQLDGGGGSYDGQTGGGELDVTGVMTNSGTVLVDVRPNDRDYNFGNSGATLNDAGVLTNTGSLMVYGGTVSSYDVQQPGGLLLDRGTLTNAARGVVSLIGGATGYVGAGGAEFNVTGVFDNDGLTRVGAGGAEGAVLTDDGVIRNHGTIALQGSSLVAAGVLVDAGRLINDGLVTIASGSGAVQNQGLTVTATGTLNNGGTIAGSGTLVNEGFIGSGGNGQTDGVISVATFVNDGTVAVAPHGALDVSSDTPFGASGTFDILADATLTLTGTMEFYQTVAFEGNNGTLAIGHAFAFFADLDLGQPHATLDFLSRDIISASVSGTHLEIGFSGGQEDQYSLTAPLPADTTIGLRQDGSGGTDVVFRSSASSSALLPSGSEHIA